MHGKRKIEMIKTLLTKLTLIAVALSISVALAAQSPSHILIEETDTRPSGLRSCDNDAGTISLGTFEGQSNDINLDTMYLCFGDRVFIEHNGDFSLDGDPDPSTPGGIGYAWYSCPPSVSGTEISDVTADPCVLNTPPPPLNDLWVYVDNPNGDALFQNGFNIDPQTTLQDFFNDGNPVHIFFAPITFDRLEPGNAPVFEEQGGEGCVNVRTDQVFSIVYLNAIEISNYTDDGGTEDISGSFLIEGGLPEFNGSSYDVSMVLSGGVIEAVIHSTEVSSGEILEFTVPEQGTYLITISDGKSCTYQVEVCVGGCLEVIVESIDVLPDEEFCIEVSVVNFNDMLGFQGAIIWNPNVIELTSFENVGLPNEFTPNQGSAGSGWITFIWLDELDGATGGISLADSSAIFEMCFRAIGDPGTSSIIDLGDRITISLFGFDITVSEVDILIRQGLVNILFPEELGFTLNKCGTEEGTDDATITVTGFGGTPPYEINIRRTDDPGFLETGIISQIGGMFTFDGLTPAIDPVFYEIEIVDSEGNAFSSLISLDNTGAPEITLTPESPTCGNATNGRITAEISGEGPFQIEWSNNSFGDSILTNIGTGQYTISVTDANGCRAEASVEVTFDEIEVNAIITNASCIGIPDGSITVIASGGEPINGNEYRYRWEGRAPQTATSTTLSNIGPGIYSLTVTDANGCSTVESFEVGFEIGINIEDVVINHESCVESEDGSITIEVSIDGPGAGSAVFAISWRDNMGNLLTSISGPGNSSTVNDLGAGVYNATILEATSGCLLIEEFEIEGPDPIEIELVRIVNQECDAPGTGEIEIAVFGGEAADIDDYQINWTGGENGTLITGLNQGDYTVTVTDLNGCEEIETFTVETADGPSIDSFTIQEPSCSGFPDGALTVNFTPGSGDVIEIDWQDGDNNNYSGPTISNLAAGSYSVTITSDDGCTAEASVELEIGGVLEVEDVILELPSCPGESDGRISIVIAGSIPDLNYEWSVDGGGPNAAVLTDIPAGTYSVTISQESENCDPVEVNDIILEDPEPLSATFEDVVATTCHNSCDGRAQISVSGGSGPGTYTYLWDNGLVGPFNPQLCGGLNPVIVSSGNCIDTFFADIPSPDQVEIILTDIIEPTCFGELNGRIEIDVTGGTGPNYVLTWDDGTIGSVLADVGGGTYAIEVIDTNNCRDTFDVELTEPELLLASINQGLSTSVSCAGREDGRIVVNTTGGTGEYSFDWTPDVSSSFSAENLAAGDYSIIVMDENGCTDEVSYTVEDANPILFTYTDPDLLNCFGDEFLFEILTAEGGSGGPYSYAINFGALIATEEPTSLPAGNYTVNVFDPEGCSASDTFRVTQPEQIIINLPEQIDIQLGDSIRLVPEIIDPVPTVSYEWITTNDILECYDCPDPIATPVDDELVTLNITNADGCQASASTFFNLEAFRNIYIPNAFSPNDDGINDVFRVYSGIGVRAIRSFRVFDRWGNKVFELYDLMPSSDGTPGWDGTINGELAAPGSYVYTVEVEFTDSLIEFYRGEIFLSR